ncbi:MAG: GerMN domain-containing protein [Kouleothrix sp.]|nr:GerMN domain-containing protein [Kouleothrix sp.]
MAEPTGHCPYLGLKQNRAIRFASPTSEHRCYISGEPLEIRFDQSSYCLAQGHVQCPLYMGLSVPTTAEPAPALAGAPAAGTGISGWFAALSQRDRLVYSLMLAMLAAIVGIYLFVGLQAWLSGDNQPVAGVATAPAPTSLPATAPAAATGTPTSPPPTPTDLPTNTPQPAPTNEPTEAPILLLPTRAPTTQPTIAPTSMPTNAPTAAPATSVPPTSAPATRAPATRVPATRAPATSVPATRVPATSVPATRVPATSVPATRVPATSVPPTQAPAPTATSPAAVVVKPLTLYFNDPTGTLLVPVRRNVPVENNRVAEAAINELIAGPRNGLGRLVNAETRLLGISIDNGRATVNFDRNPGGFDSIIFTLTEFPTISSVQVQINGANQGQARGRPVLNPLNPQNLPVDYAKTEFLPLYFPAAGSRHDIRVIRMVPKTKQTAEATVRALLEGPGAYAGALRRVIPEGTQLRGIKIEKGVVLVDFTRPFADAPELDAAMRTVVESLTTLKTVSGVQFLVEGQAFADGKIFARPAINQE